MGNGGGPVEVNEGAEGAGLLEGRVLDVVEEVPGALLCLLNAFLIQSKCPVRPGGFDMLPAFL